MNEKQLYPLKFTPILKDKIWGGNKLRTILNKDHASDEAGESWEVSGVKGNLSIVSEGFLKGNNLEELIEIYMGDLIGEKVYDKFGTEFPLLIKYIDANDALSIQVHPDDELAKERHNSFGKTEMWYIIDTEPKAEIIVGFNKDVSRNEYIEKLNEKSLSDILNVEHSKPGDVFFLPAKRVHAIGAGNLLAEIQQTSDITYRIYDFDRKDSSGNTRELHTDLALDSIDYTSKKNYKTAYRAEINKTTEIESCQYFTTNFLHLTDIIVKDFQWLDSFIIYMCVEGSIYIEFGEDKVSLEKGETVLVPNTIRNFSLNPLKNSKVLEVYIKENNK